MRWIAILLLTFAVGCSLPKKSNELGYSYEKREIDLPGSTSRTILVGKFSGEKELGVVSVYVGEDNKRILCFHEYKSPIGNKEFYIGNGTGFVDVVRFSSRDYVVFYEDGDIKYFDRATEKIKSLFKAPIRFHSLDDKIIPRLHFCQDIDGDGKQDIVLPDVSGYWIAIQKEFGIFSSPQFIRNDEPFRDSLLGVLDVSIPWKNETTTYGDVGITKETFSWYMSRFFHSDWDLDGKEEIVLWDKNNFRVLDQTEDQKYFDSDMRSTEMAIDSVGAYSRIFDYNQSGLLSTLSNTGKYSEKTILISMEDVNGDTISDISTMSLAGSSILKQKCEMNVFFGEIIDSQTRFKNMPDIIIPIHSRRSAVEAWGYSTQIYKDINRDGKNDLGIVNVDMGVGGVFRAIAGNSIALDIWCYDLNESHIENQLIYHKRVRPRWRLFNQKGPYFPLVLLTDLDGDGVDDLVVGDSHNEILLYRGIVTELLFNEVPILIKAELPSNEKNAWSYNLNGDQKMDLVFYHPPQSGNHRLQFLISK